MKDLSNLRCLTMCRADPRLGAGVRGAGVRRDAEDGPGGLLSCGTPCSLSSKKTELASSEDIELGFGVGLFWLCGFGFFGWVWFVFFFRLAFISKKIKSLFTEL